MFYSALKFIHVMAVILWVGGMLFAHCFLRPAAARLEPPVRLRLMASVLSSCRGAGPPWPPAASS
jgi:uncharacterized membrane protein